jgi:outer membrane immunogenic protein
MNVADSTVNNRETRQGRSQTKQEGARMQFGNFIKLAVATSVTFAAMQSMSAVAQEARSEISIEGTGFFTKDSSGNGVQDHVTNTGGFLIGYRYNVNRWLAAEANYGYDRNTQIYSGSGLGRVESNVHQATGEAVVKLPGFLRLQPYALAGGGALMFDPTGNAGGSFAGATWEPKGAFVYGAGADYAFTKHLSLRAEYRGFVYKAPDFNVASLNTNAWTHTAQPSAGIVFRF